MGTLSEKRNPIILDMTFLKVIRVAVFIEALLFHTDATIKKRLTATTSSSFYETPDMAGPKIFRPVLISNEVDLPTRYKRIPVKVHRQY